MFEEACNLVADDGDVLSLVTESVGDGPFNLVLPDVDLTSFISPESRAECRAGRLRLGGIEVDSRSTKVWEARPDWAQARFVLVTDIGFLVSLPVDVVERPFPDENGPL